MKIKYRIVLLLFINLIISACSEKPQQTESFPEKRLTDSVVVLSEKSEDVSSGEIKIEKEFLYDKYTLEDTYPYKDTTRMFQWDKIKESLGHLQKIQIGHNQWGILQNYKNCNGEAPLIKEYKRNEYKRIADDFGVERYQGIPLFAENDTVTAERYGRDGSLIKVISEDNNNSSRFIKVKTTDFDGTWYIPKIYVKTISDTVEFNHVIVVDRNNENIITLEKSGNKWLVRSMNPATTGLHKPPYQQETPLGMFVIQEKKNKMFFLKDGTTATGGFAPYANRFTNGGYIHGVPVNAPRTSLIEYSSSLGTTPRSHMCVRNATSHAKFIYDQFPTMATIVFVIE